MKCTKHRRLGCCEWSWQDRTFRVHLLAISARTLPSAWDEWLRITAPYAPVGYWAGYTFVLSPSFGKCTTETVVGLLYPFPCWVSAHTAISLQAYHMGNRELRLWGNSSPTWQLSPWNVVLGKLTRSLLFKKFRTFYGTRKFITAFIRARHMSLFWARSIHSLPTHPTSHPHNKEI